MPACSESRIFRSSEVPDGDASGNTVVRAWGSVPQFDFTPKPHWELGAALGLFDLPRGAKITGSGFPVYTGMGARLVRALKNFMLDLHTRDHGYLEVATPYIVNRATMTGTGQLPKFEEELYVIGADDLFLIPTAEVPVTNLHRDEILDGASLPLGYVAYTPCFRREAGAHGKDTRESSGYISSTRWSWSVSAGRRIGADQHALLTSHAEKVLQLLELPYRVMALAAGDTGFASAFTV